MDDVVGPDSSTPTSTDMDDVVGPDSSTPTSADMDDVVGPDSSTPTSADMDNVVGPDSSLDPRRVGRSAAPRSSIESAIHDLAARQHGVVARRQLLAAGYSAHTVENQVKNGSLARLHRGVYGVGPLRAPRQAEMAATLALGDSAVVSHWSAAALYGIASAPGRQKRLMHISVPRGNPRPRKGLRTYRSTTLHDDEWTSLEGIPVTTPARTILDLAGTARPATLEQALARADRQGLTDARAVGALLCRHPCRAGNGTLKAILARVGEPMLLRSEAEALLLTLVRKGRLAPPRTNVHLEGYEVDFLWRSARLVVDVDGFAFHSSGQAFESDRRRDAALTAAGFRVMRVTWRRLTNEPEAVLVDVAKALAGSVR